MLRKSLHKTGANIQGRLNLAGVDKSVYRKWSRCTFRSSQTGSYELVRTSWDHRTGQFLIIK